MFVSEKPFVSLPPSAQNAVDIFSGEWASRLPPESGATSGGTAGLFDDERIRWADAKLRETGMPGFSGQSVLELGPLEGGHSHMLDRFGAREVVAVEANARAYLKCLVVKELLGMSRVKFLLGDALHYMRSLERRFDVGVACAFLNHMVDPVDAIALLARCCRCVYVWNVVYDPALFVKQPALSGTFGPAVEAEHAGFRHTLYPHRYGEGIDYGKFLGGTQPSCSWMKSADIIGALRHFGFKRLIWQEDDHPYGKVISVAAAMDS
jgi:hypothetical protein